MAQAELGLALCKALGLDSEWHVYSIEMSCKVGEVATVTVGRFLEHKDVRKMKRILEHYELVKKGGR